MLFFRPRTAAAATALCMQKRSGVVLLERLQSHIPFATRDAGVSFSKCCGFPHTHTEIRKDDAPPA